MSQAPSYLIDTIKRPIPIRMRSDLLVETIAYQDFEDYVVKDPVSLEYYRLRSEQFRVLELLNGKRSPEEIRRELQREFPTLRPTLADIHLLVHDLHKKGLVVSERNGQGQTLRDWEREQRRRRFFAACKNVFYVKVPGWDPQGLLSALYPFAKWLFHPISLIGIGLGVAITWVFLLINFAEFERRLPEFQQFFSWPNLAYLWLTIGAAKLFHEIAHGLACRHAGRESHEIGVAFLVFSPCLYCDVSDSWILPSKWQRIGIASAGMAAEVAVSALAIIVWWHTEPSLLHYLALNVFLVTTITTVIFNANPLLKFDGYYILSDWLEIPNLRGKADRLLRNTFARLCFGIQLPRDPFLPDRGRWRFVAYSVAAAGYRWFIAFTIVFTLYQWLKPYGLQNLGLFLGLLSIVGILGSLATSVYRIVTMPRKQRIQPVRVLATLTVLVGLGAAAWFIPLPIRVEAPLTLEPDGIRHVYTSTPGTLIDVLVQPGARVESGQVLARCTNFDQEQRVRQLEMTLETQEVEVRMHEILRDHPSKELAEATLQTTRDRLTEAKQKLTRLEVVAPCDGVVIAPPTVRKSSDKEDSLPTWEGSPLASENRGCWLPPRTHLLSLAPTEETEAVLLIDQSDRNRVIRGAAVKILFDGMPGQTVSTAITELAPADVKTVPPALSNKFGGPLATVSNEKNDEVLSRSAYRATLAMPTPPFMTRPGMRGRARITIAEQTAAEWVWRSVQETFHFKL